MKKLFYQILRFCLSGGVGVLAGFITLYVLTEYFGVWYLFSSIIAGIVNGGINFLLEKYWTFQNKDREAIYKQAGFYTALRIFLEVLDIFLLYALVEYFHLHYMAGQVVAMVILSVVSFVVCRRIFFQRECSFKEISHSDEARIVQVVELISHYSWGKDYPMSPLEEIKNAQYRVGVFSDERLIGFGSVGNRMSPDGHDNDQVWLGHAVVHPDYRGQGIFRKIYEYQMVYAQKHTSCVYSCTDNPIVKKFFSRQGWKFVRKTTDEAGGDAVVFKRAIL